VALGVSEGAARGAEVLEMVPNMVPFCSPRRRSKARRRIAQDGPLSSLPSPLFTMNVYTMGNVSDQAAAVESLPAVPGAGRVPWGVNGCGSGRDFDGLPFPLVPAKHWRSQRHTARLHGRELIR
jgi:hypothetical protein